MRKTLKAIFLIMLVACLLLSGCTQPSAGPNVNAAPEGNGQVQKLVIGTTNKVEDPNINDYYFGIFILQLSHQGLVRIDSNGDFSPELAKSWDTADLKKWTFHLVNNATWHDGTPVTARDLKFTIEYLPQKIASWKSSLGSIESVEAPDDHTLVINLKKPDYNFLTNIAVIRTLPEHIFKAVDDPKKFNDPKAAIGCGPYKFASFDKSAGILTFKANEDYWGPKPAIDTIEIRTFSNMDTLMLAFQKGEVDVPYTYAKGISYYYVPRLLGNDNVGIMMKRDGGIGNVLWFNTNKSPYDNKLFRQAISYAINYEELKNLFTAGYGVIPDAGWVPEGSLYYTETRELSLDVNKSKALLDSMGMKDVNGDGNRELPDGAKFQPVILTQSTNADYIRASEMLQKYLKAVGIDAVVKPVSNLGDILDIDKSHEMAVTRTTYWGMMMGEGYGTGYVDTRYYGWSMVDDPAYHNIVDDLGLTFDASKRQALAEDIQQYYAEEVPQLSLYSMDVIQPYNKEYAGWGYNPLHGIMCYDTLFNLHKA